MNYLKQRIGRILSELDRRVVIDRRRVEGITLCECDYKNGANLPPVNAGWRPFGWGETFGGSFEWHGWFRATLRIPEDFRGKQVELYNYASRQAPQFITYLDGKTVQGMDPNHRAFPLDSQKSEYELLTYAYVGYNSDSSEYCPELRLIDPDTRKLYWDLRVPYDVMSLLPEDSVEFCDIRTALNEAINRLDLRTRGHRGVPAERARGHRLSANRVLRQGILPMTFWSAATMNLPPISPGHWTGRGTQLCSAAPVFRVDCSIPWTGRPSKTSILLRGRSPTT